MKHFNAAQLAVRSYYEAIYLCTTENAHNSNPIFALANKNTVICISKFINKTWKKEEEKYSYYYLKI